MKRVLVVGIGNQIRQDDAIGPYVIDLLEKRLQPEKKELVDFMVVHQLDLVHCEKFAGYTLIIFIDADAVQGDEDVRVEEVLPRPGVHPFTTHIGSIPDLMALTHNLYGVSPKTYLIAVKGWAFEVGEGLSPEALKNAGTAYDFACKLIDEFLPFH